MDLRLQDLMERLQIGVRKVDELRQLQAINLAQMVTQGRIDFCFGCQRRDGVRNYLKTTSDYLAACRY